MIPLRLLIGFKRLQQVPLFISILQIRLINSVSQKIYLENIDNVMPATDELWRNVCF